MSSSVPGLTHSLSPLRLSSRLAMPAGMQGSLSSLQMMLASPHPLLEQQQPQHSLSQCLSRHASAQRAGRQAVGRRRHRQPNRQLSLPRATRLLSQRLLQWAPAREPLSKGAHRLWRGAACARRLASWAWKTNRHRLKLLRPLSQPPAQQGPAARQLAAAATARACACCKPARPGQPLRAGSGPACWQGQQPLRRGRSVSCH
jgi:hypothetical protein